MMVLTPKGYYPQLLFPDYITEDEVTVFLDDVYAFQVKGANMRYL
jgi:hypothetical protein